jgi:hypothetical protein
MDSKIRQSRSFVAVVTLLVVSVGILAACGGGTSKLETGRTFDSLTFSESDARGTLQAAVREACLDSNFRRLLGPLRTVDIATATKHSGGWDFRANGKVAAVSSGGRVSGELLKDLTSQC